MQKLELLSPAKDLQTALAAINCGADAIYIGADDFGAREAAKNSLEDIEKVIKYAHLFNVKVYVTLNTILDDDELIKCQKIIRDLYEIKADGIIVQDFGIFYLSAQNLLPEIALHASTQCDIRDVSKVKFFEEMGLKRVVLARELSLDEIKKISKQTNIELEYFIHGALCVSYSGQCYMSQYIGGRSANRGCCAQACRKKYSLIDENQKYILKNKYLLSLKDNNLSKHLKKLIDSGISSFKIEGRLKDINYVKNITLYYHNLLKDYPRTSFGVIVQDFAPNPDKTFNRGYCDDYLFSKKDNIYNFLTPKSTGEFLGEVENVSQDNFTIKTKAQINPQDGLCFILKDEFTGCLVNRVQNIKEGAKIYPNKKLNLKKGTKVYRNLDIIFNKTLANSKTVRKLEISFKVFEDKIEVRDENSNKTELKIEIQEFAQNQEKMRENFIKSLSKTSDSPYLVKNIEFCSNNLPFVPVSKINELRRDILESLSEKILSRYKTKKQKPLNPAKYPLERVDYRANINNKSAKEFMEFCEAEVLEMSFEKENSKKAQKRELMRMKHCLKRASVGCKDTRKLFLEDDRGVKYPLLFDCKKCEMAVLEP